jgi:ATP/maltotriose-dependent transcriptional regulator MalT
LEEARTLGLRTVESLQLASLAISADASGDLVGALGLQLQSLQLSREAGDRVSEATCLSNLGRVRLLLGDLSQARRDLSAALEMLKANDDRVVESWALTHLAMLTLWQGDEPRALALARQAVDIAAVAQAPNYEAFAGIALGGAELDVGRRAEARQAYARALKQALLTGDVQTQHSANAGLARVALAEGDTATALAVLLPVLDHAAAGRSFESDVLQPRLIELTCYQALTRANDPGSAEWLTRAHSALMTQADTITDPALRQGFLENIPHHRAIAVAWAGRRPAGSAAGSTSE